MGSIFATFREQLVGTIRTVWIMDIVDVIFVAYLVYKFIKLVRETRAGQLVKGILLLIVGYALASALGLRTMSFLLESVFQFGMVAVLVVFQPELRRALEQVGRTKISNLGVFSSMNLDEQDDERRWKEAISAICNAAASLSKRKTGALIVMERQTRLGEIIKTGTVVDSAPSAELFGNIFFPNSPLHDGAVVMRGGKIYAAGCFLPLSENHTISKDLGTRHRAALGMSEESDAVVVVVSEETGVISVAKGGRLTRDYDVVTLERELLKDMLPESENEEGKNERRPIFRKGKGR